MADVVGAVEEVHLPLPPPISGLLTAGPYNFQFTGEDNLRLTVVNALAGVSVAVHFRTAPTPTSTNANREVLVPSADRMPSVLEFGVGEGYLLNVSVFASSGAPTIGQTFVKLQVIRGFGSSALVLGTILQDYITASQDVAWPGSPLRSSLDGPGTVRIISGTNPAAGVNVSDVVPTGARWRLMAWRCPFVCDATVITRRAFLAIQDSGGNNLLLIPQAEDQLAGQSKTYHYMVGLPFVAVVEAGRPTQGLPNDCYVFAGQRIATGVANLQAGDDWGTPTLFVQEWLEVA